MTEEEQMVTKDGQWERSGSTHSIRLGAYELVVAPEADKCVFAVTLGRGPRWGSTLINECELTAQPDIGSAKTSAMAIALGWLHIEAMAARDAYEACAKAMGMRKEDGK